MSSHQDLDATVAAAAAIGGTAKARNKACRRTQANPSPVRRGWVAVAGRARRPHRVRRWPPSLRTPVRRTRAWARWGRCSGSRQPSSRTHRHCICAHRLQRPQRHQGPGWCWLRHRPRQPSLRAPRRGDAGERLARWHRHADADADADADAHADGDAPAHAGWVPTGRLPLRQRGGGARSPPSPPPQRPGRAAPAPAARSAESASAQTWRHCSARGQAGPGSESERAQHPGIVTSREGGLDHLCPETVSPLPA